MSMALTFQDTTFDVLDRNGQPWLRLYQIGSALGYDRPEVSVAQLYSRHADEFTPEMTTVVKLPTEGGEQCTRIFSLRGCHLLAMLARTPIAKAFRKWVLDILDRLDKEHNHPQPTQPALPPLDAPITPDQQCTLQSLVKARVDAIPQEERTNAIYPQIWGRFKNHFRIAKYNQLPQTRLAEAIEYLAKLEIKKSKKQQPALPPENTPATTAPQVESNTIPALPDNQYPDHAKDTLKLLEKIQKELHEVRVVSSVRSLPASQNLASRRDSERFAIEESLYQMVDGLLFSTWHAVNAGAKIRRWKE